MRRQAFLAVIAAISLGAATRTSADERPGPKVRFLTAREARAIVREAVRADTGDERITDCSHLVHDLFERAGYPYTYASSLELYEGTEHFQRVRTPQPGDLIVWRGHAGIVLSPAQHTFFSSASAGPRTEHYDSEYWRERGYARFYRYVKPAPNLSAMR
jgi:cell wall-associated NlpC family hydrolase